MPKNRVFGRSGGGTCVVKDIPPRSTVVGTAARIIHGDEVNA